MQTFIGASVAAGDLLVYSGFTGGRICESHASRYLFFFSGRALTFYYHTDGSNAISSAQGLEISFEPQGMPILRMKKSS